MRKMILAPLLFVLIFALFLPTAGAAGRERLNAVDKGAYTASDTEAELAFGREVAARILARFPLLDNNALNRYVGLVGTGLASEGGRPDLQYRFAVLDTDVPNAFAAPGGYVFITRGALYRMHDEAELAAVLSHEISHISRRHIVRSLNLRSGGGDAVGGLARVIGGAGEVSRVAMGKLVDLAEEILFKKGYAVDDEIEADADAVALSGDVGYDPAALERYLARVEPPGEQAPVSMGVTHPGFGKRKSLIDGVIKNDGLDAVKSADMKERFDENVKIR